MTKLEILIKLQGKKVVWAGFDRDTDGFILLFDDGTSLNISDFEPIDDFSDVSDRMLQADLTEAKQICSLADLKLKAQAGAEVAPKSEPMAKKEDHGKE